MMMPEQLHPSTTCEVRRDGDKFVVVHMDESGREISTRAFELRSKADQCVKEWRHAVESRKHADLVLP